MYLHLCTVYNLMSHIFYAVRNYIEIIPFESIQFCLYIVYARSSTLYISASRSCPAMAVSSGAPE